MLEFGAGIGRFTGELAQKAGEVIALDFIESAIKKNESVNGHYKNVKFMCADVTSPDLKITDGSIDLIFSNWLLMYLSDKEVFKECQTRDASGNSFELSMVGCKCIGAYVKNKKNQNQTTKEFVAKMDLKPGQKVLDVGCGIGGGDFYMAENFDVHVVGIDLSVNMISFALERAIGLKCSVEFEVADCTTKMYPDNSFDVVYSHDTILHIQDKPALFKTFFKWLKPGGKVLISDYCRNAAKPSPDFAEYIKQRGYDLHDVQAYGQMLKDAGFEDMIAEDRTDQFVQVLRRELETGEKEKEEFISDFSEEDYNDIVGGWKAKLERTSSGEQKWGLFIANKK